MSVLLIVLLEEWLQRSIRLLAQQRQPLDSPLDQAFQILLQVNLSHESKQEQDKRIPINRANEPFVLRACLFAGQEANKRLDGLLDILLPCLPMEESIALGGTDQCLMMIEVATPSRLPTHVGMLLIRFSPAAVA